MNKTRMGDAFIFCGRIRLLPRFPLRCRVHAPADKLTTIPRHALLQQCERDVRERFPVLLLGIAAQSWHYQLL
jgi:hypothetical protein